MMLLLTLVIKTQGNAAQNSSFCHTQALQLTDLYVTWSRVHPPCHFDPERVLQESFAFRKTNRTRGTICANLAWIWWVHHVKPCRW